MHFKVALHSSLLILQLFVKKPCVFAHVFILNMPSAHRSSNEVRGWFFCEFPLSTMLVLLDVHAASNDQQNAVACGTASSHEDLHVVTSISTCFGLSELAVCLSKYCVTRNGSLFGIPINNCSSFFIHKFFQFFLVAGLQSVPSTNFECGKFRHNLWMNFGIHHAVLHEFFIHHDVLVTVLTFPTFPSCHPKGVETCHALNLFIQFTSLPQISGKDKSGRALGSRLSLFSCRG